MAAYSNASSDKLYSPAPRLHPRARCRRGRAAAGAAAHRRRPGRRHRGRYRPALRRRLHRDLRAVGRPLHRRSCRHDAAVRREPGRRRRHRRRIVPRPRRAVAEAGDRPAQPRRRRQDHLLPPAQGHAAHARRAGPRRHRLGGARGRVLRAARLDAVAAQPHPHARGADARHPLGRADGPARGAPSTRSATPSTFARSASSKAGTTSATSVSSSGGSAATAGSGAGPAAGRRRRLPLSFQSARQLGAAVQPAAARGRRDRPRHRTARPASHPPGALLRGSAHLSGASRPAAGLHRVLRAVRHRPWLSGRAGGKPDGLRRRQSCPAGRGSAAATSPTGASRRTI